MLVSLATEAVVATVLGGSSRDSHGSVTAVDSLHLNEGALLVVLVGEANEAVAAALTAHSIGHDLGRLARGETSLEERNQDVLVDLGTKVANENAVLGAAIIPGYVSKRYRQCRWVTYRRSTRPPPEAQLSLKERLLLGTCEPFMLRALVAASGLWNSTKQ